jgi:hypothetical protein
MVSSTVAILAQASSAKPFESALEVLIILIADLQWRKRVSPLVVKRCKTGHHRIAPWFAKKVALRVDDQPRAFHIAVAHAKVLEERSTVQDVSSALQTFASQHIRKSQLYPM